MTIYENIRAMARSTVDELQFFSFRLLTNQIISQNSISLKIVFKNDFPFDKDSRHFP
jgi:hypothetical protein